MDAGQVLKRHRQQVGLSQQEVAVALDMSLPIVSRWERGVNVPRHDVAQRLDDFLAAGGEVLQAFGYVSSPQPEAVIVALQARDERQAEQIEALAKQLDQLQSLVDLVVDVASAQSSTQGQHPEPRSSQSEA